MDKKFVTSVNEKCESLLSDSYFSKWEMFDEILRMNARLTPDDYIKYHYGFFSLFKDNEELDIVIAEYLKLLSNPNHYRQDIYGGVTSMVRELRLPNDQSSRWQLLYETLILPTYESGPILHLFFDGWKAETCKIYYWDESAFNDITDDEESEEDEISNARDKIEAYGFKLDESLGDEDALIIKRILDNY